MKLSILVLLLIANQAFSQTFREKELKTSIKEVTVFLQSAQITRSGQLSVPAGKTLLTVKSLSPFMDHNSIQVKGNGDFTILSVNHKFNHLNDLKKDAAIDSLEKQSRTLYEKISVHQSRLDVLKEKQSVLNENKKLGSVDGQNSLDQLSKAIEFYDKQLSTIKNEELKINKSIDALLIQISKIEKQVSAVNGQKNLPSGEIVIRVNALQKTTANFNITYLVGNTGWYPGYDVRVENIEKPINLKYKADVYQNTGVDWKNVKLKFSNGNPSQTGVAPKLSAWYLSFVNAGIYRNQYAAIPNTTVRQVKGKVTSAEDGSTLPGVNVVVKGSTVGTVTDIDGNYSLTLPSNAQTLVFSFIGMATQEQPIYNNNINVAMNPSINDLEEVVVTGYGSELKGSVRGISSIYGSRADKKEVARLLATKTVENQTTVEFEVSEPYSIKSNGEKLSIDLKEFSIEAIYEYYAVPKLDKDAFLIARIINWDQYNLLEGEANLYFEEAYVGRSILDAKSLSDTLNISLGRDKSIVVGRKKVDEFSRRRTVGTNKLETREFEILVRNKKSQAIKLKLFDQLPVSSYNNINVTPTELSNGKLDELTGEITWQIDLKPKEQTELKMSYEVKYPKKERLALE